MGRGPVQVREASSHTAVGRQVDATWSGRICTWPVLTTDTRRIGSVMFIACSPVLVAEPGGYGCPTGRSRDAGRLSWPATWAPFRLRTSTLVSSVLFMPAIPFADPGA